MMKNILVLTIFAIAISNCVNSSNPNDKEKEDFFLSVYKSNIIKVSDMLKKYPQLVNEKIPLKNGDFTTPLSVAVGLMNEDLVKTLFQFGANVNMPGEGGGYPLHVAVSHDDQNIVKLLLENGADPNLVSAAPVNQIPIFFSFETKNEKIFDLLSNKSNINHVGYQKLSLLHYSIIMNFSYATKKILELGGNPNIQDEEGLTPIYIAALKGDVEVVKTLIKYGANVDLRGKNGKRPIDVTSDKTIIRILNIDPSLQ